MCLSLWKATAVNSKLNLAPCVDSETETDSSKCVAKEYNRWTDKVKNTLKQEICHFYFHLTHILEISRFEVPSSRFFWAFFQHLQICMFWRLAGLFCRRIAWKRSSFSLFSAAWAHTTVLSPMHYSWWPNLLVVADAWQWISVSASFWLYFAGQKTSFR